MALRTFSRDWGEGGLPGIWATQAAAISGGREYHYQVSQKILVREQGMSVAERAKNGKLIDPTPDERLTSDYLRQPRRNAPVDYYCASRYCKLIAPTAWVKNMSQLLLFCFQKKVVLYF